MEQKTYLEEMGTSQAEDASDAISSPRFAKRIRKRTGIWILRLVWALAAAAIAAFALMVLTPLPVYGCVIAGVVAGTVLFSCTHVAMEWERLVVLRAGAFRKVAGPGFILTLPFVDSVTARVDMRMRSTPFKAEHVLTADLVPVNVDAVLFWTVWDAEKACCEVENFEHQVYWVTQTTLRNVLGSVSIAELSTRREQIDQEVTSILEEKTNDWGITVASVEIRDIDIPEELQESLSAEAQAERQYNARIILAEVEREAAEMFVEAADIYGRPEAALQLRAMSFVADSVKENGGLVVIPSGLSEAFDGLEKLIKA